MLQPWFSVIANYPLTVRKTEPSTKPSARPMNNTADSAADYADIAGSRKDTTTDVLETIAAMFCLAAVAIIGYWVLRVAWIAFGWLVPTIWHITVWLLGSTLAWSLWLCFGSLVVAVVLSCLAARRRET